MRDPYEVLEVSREASSEEIKVAYRRLARRYHPDVNPGDRECEEKFKEIGQAYAVLSDSDRRARYDRFGALDEQVPMDVSGGFTDLFDMFFGGGEFGGTRARSGRDGDDVRADVTLTLGEVLTGVTKEVSYMRSVKCGPCKGIGSEGGTPPKTCAKCGGSGAISQVRDTFIGSIRTAVACNACRGTGQVVEKVCSHCKGVGLIPEETKAKVEIPPGVDEGLTVRVAGKGGDGIGAGTKGDLYVVLHVQADPRFRRNGTDLISFVNLSFAQAALGDSVDIEGIDSDYEVEIPRGTQPGAVLRIEGAGLPHLHGGRRGDIVLQVSVEVPNDLSQAQEDLIRQLAELRGEHLQPKDSRRSAAVSGLFKKGRKVK
jgi:molecular chaperone DnaJ